MTAGTIFDKTRTPLTVWFHACWLFATAKDGISAQHLQRVLEIGSYQTAWAMLHRLRSALVRPGRDRLSGTVEVDETYIGGEEPGLRGGRQRGKKVLTGIAVEVREPKGIGRCRMAPLDDASGDTLGSRSSPRTSSQGRRSSLTAGPLTGPSAARDISTGPSTRKRPAPLGMTRTACCPESIGSPRCASGGCWAPTRARLTPRTCPPISTSSSSGSTAADRPAGAWCSTGSCSSAAGHEPVRYVDLLASKKPRRAKRAEGGTGHPPSLERPAADRPWRTAEIQLQFPVRLSGYPSADYRLVGQAGTGARSRADRARV